MTNSDNTIRPEDSLKPLDQISTADPRNKHINIANWHADIANITLIESTPNEVKQLFENAKNIALYTYFSYRLHQAAETIGFSALEKALKMKYEQEKDTIAVQHPPARLMDYMNITLEQGWIANEGYESARPLAEGRVWHKNIVNLIGSGQLDNGESIPIPEPKEHEITAELRVLDIAKKRLHSGRHIRNYLAHGDGGLLPSSMSTLEGIAEEINQLFKTQSLSDSNQNS